MGFSDSQVGALRRAVSVRHIRTRVADGRTLSYVEGWFAIAQANRIFGFDGWDRETVDAKCVQSREARGSCSVLYTVRVRVTVRSADGVVVREGFGTGQGRGNDLGEAHDLALKAAETDATKRALVTFGKAFGLALYAEPGRRSAGGAGAVSASPHGGPLVGVGEATPAVARDAGPALEGSNVAEAATASMLPGARIDKSVLMLAEPRRIRDKDHLRYVASQPCMVCNRILAEAHHVRFAQPKAFGNKVSDEFTVPLCRDHHRELHNRGNERAWWHDMGLDPLPVAKRLWNDTRQTNLGPTTLRTESLTEVDCRTATPVLRVKPAR